MGVIAIESSDLAAAIGRYANIPLGPFPLAILTFLLLFLLLLRSIQIGNILHKTAVLAGLGCWVTAGLRLPLMQCTLPLGAASAAGAAVYALSWQDDPLCKYQVDQFGDELNAIPAQRLKRSGSYMILVHRDDAVRKRLQNVFGIACALLCAVKLYRHTSA